MIDTRLIASICAWLREHPEGLAPVETPLLDRMERTPATGIVHEWKPANELYDRVTDARLFPATPDIDRP